MPLEATAEIAVQYFTAMAVSPDDSLLAYGIAASVNDARYDLYVKDLRSATVSKLPGNVPATVLEQGMASVPAWSPDSQHLAYIDTASGQSRLRIWSRASGASRVAEDAYACSRAAACVYDIVHWSPDSEMIYFLASEQQGAAKRDVTLEAVGTSIEGTVSVRTTAAKKTELGRLRAGVADVFAYSLARRRSVQLTSNAQFENFRVSPDGKLIVGARLAPNLPANAKQSLYRYYVFAAKTPPNVAHSRKIDGEGVMASGRPIEPTAVARQWQAAFRWSPDSRHIAFIESGSLTDGDVMVLDARSGATRVLTKGQPFGAVSDFDLTASSARHYGYPGTKFGNSLEAPVWTPSGSAVLVSRVGMESGNRRTRLWRIDASTGQLRRLGAKDACDLMSFGVDAQDSRIVMLEQCEETLRISLTSPERTIATFPAAASRAFQYAGGHAYFPFENASSPPEIVSVSLADKIKKAITSVNDAVHGGNIQVRAVKWTTVDGRSIAAPLYFKEGAKRKLIIHVYPPDFFVFSPPRLNAFADKAQLEPGIAELIDHGYAVLDRPSAMPAGGGRTCDRLGRDMEEALDAVAKTGFADVSRPGIYGHSFGGYAVNCIITRTHRFKAAVSVAGLSDLISLHFTTAGGETIAGGGQVGAMGGSLWEAPLRYWQESPVAGIRAVETPLLLIHGALDRQVPVSQSREMFEGLSNLGKDVTLVEYVDGDHGSSFLRTEDFQKRVVAFFDSKLEG